MKFCQAHWDALRSAIEARRLSHLVAKDGAAAMRHMMAQAEERAGLEDYDPLMASHWMIVNRVLEVGGLAMLHSVGCPLCEVEKNLPGGAAQWIDGCTHAVRAYCVQHGLVSA